MGVVGDLAIGYWGLGPDFHRLCPRLQRTLCEQALIDSTPNIRFQVVKHPTPAPLGLPVRRPQQPAPSTNGHVPTPVVCFQPSTHGWLAAHACLFPEWRRSVRLRDGQGLPRSVGSFRCIAIGHDYIGHDYIGHNYLPRSVGSFRCVEHRTSDSVCCPPLFDAIAWHPPNPQLSPTAASADNQHTSLILPFAFFFVLAFARQTSIITERNGHLATSTCASLGIANR